MTIELMAGVTLDTLHINKDDTVVVTIDPDTILPDQVVEISKKVREWLSEKYPDVGVIFVTKGVSFDIAPVEESIFEKEATWLDVTMNLFDSIKINGVECSKCHTQFCGKYAKAPTCSACHSIMKV